MNKIITSIVIFLALAQALRCNTSQNEPVLLVNYDSINMASCQTIDIDTLLSDKRITENSEIKHDREFEKQLKFSYKLIGFTLLSKENLGEIEIQRRKYLLSLFITGIKGESQWL